MLLYLSTTGSDDKLTLTTNQTAVCLGDCYYLFCANHKPLADCGANDVTWFSSSSTEMITNDSTHMMSTENATLMVLKILITEDEFREPQNFSCKAISCMSNVVSVGKYGEFKSGTHVYTNTVVPVSAHYTTCYWCPGGTTTAIKCMAQPRSPLV